MTEPTLNTRRAYRSDWSDFSAWCARHRFVPLPAAPATVAAYLRDRADLLAPATVARRLAGIVDMHRGSGFTSPRDDPCVREALAAAEWRYRARRRPTTPLDVESLARMSLCLAPTTSGTRDRSLLLLAYGAALRRTEVVGLDVRDVSLTSDKALRITLPRGSITVPPGSQPHLCASRAWLRWLQRSGADHGPAYRPVDRHGNVHAARLSDAAVTSIVRRAAQRAGLDPNRYSGRSLRLGMVLAAHAHGASDEDIMRQTGHRTRRLVREYRADRHNAPS